MDGPNKKAGLFHYRPNVGLSLRFPRLEGLLIQRQADAFELEDVFLENPPPRRQTHSHNTQLPAAATAMEEDPPRHSINNNQQRAQSHSLRYSHYDNYQQDLTPLAYATPSSTMSSATAPVGFWNDPLEQVLWVGEAFSYENGNSTLQESAILVVTHHCRLKRTFHLVLAGGSASTKTSDACHVLRCSSTITSPTRASSTKTKIQSSLVLIRYHRLFFGIPALLLRITWIQRRETTSTMLLVILHIPLTLNREDPWRPMRNTRLGEDSINQEQRHAITKKPWPRHWGCLKLIINAKHLAILWRLPLGCPALVGEEHQHPSFRQTIMKIAIFCPQPRLRIIHRQC